MKTDLFYLCNHWCYTPYTRLFHDGSEHYGGRKPVLKFITIRHCWSLHVTPVSYTINALSVLVCAHMRDRQNFSFLLRMLYSLCSHVVAFALRYPESVSYITYTDTCRPGAKRMVVCRDSCAVATWGLSTIYRFKFKYRRSSLKGLFCLILISSWTSNSLCSGRPVFPSAVCSDPVLTGYAETGRNPCLLVVGRSKFTVLLTPWLCASSYAFCQQAVLNTTELDVSVNFGCVKLICNSELDWNPNPACFDSGTWCLWFEITD